MLSYAMAYLRLLMNRKKIQTTPFLRKATWFVKENDG